MRGLILQLNLLLLLGFICCDAAGINPRYNGGRQRSSNRHVSDEFDSYSFESEEYHDFFPVPGDTEDSLLLVNVLFRHGNRTADSKAELYPGDPHLNFEYFPYGLGQLTKAGKVREYSIGTALRQRYNLFLGEHYYPEVVEARSTDYNRTKMSLQLVLAGLFPPAKDAIFVPELTSWQPVPYNYVPRSQDYLLLGSLCPRYQQLYRDYMNTEKMKTQFQRYNKLFQYVTRHSGRNVTKFQDIYNMYFGLSTETEFGLTLPSWLRAVWPKKVINMSIKEYYASMGTPEMKKILTGPLLEKIIKDATNRLADTRDPGRKIYLYSAHENNVAELLIALGVFDNQIPNYGAYVIVEVHSVNGVPGFKILYENYNGRGPTVLKMPACEEICPLHKFEAILRDILPQPTEQLC